MDGDTTRWGIIDPTCRRYAKRRVIKHYTWNRHVYVMTAELEMAVNILVNSLPAAGLQRVRDLLIHADVARDYLPDQQALQRTSAPSSCVCLSLEARGCN